MAIRRDFPYVWVTWLTKLLTGELSCEWSGWFRSMYDGRSWKRTPSTFDFAKWQLDHTDLLKRCVEELEYHGNKVFIENQNSFNLRGKSATLAGKPDIISVNGDSGLIVDAKTGAESPAHTVQVLIYMYAIPRSLRQFEGVKFDGRIVYNDNVIDIPHSALDEVFVNNFSKLMKTLSSDNAPRRVPSNKECRFCDITSEDCSSRIESDVTASVGITEDF